MILTSAALGGCAVVDAADLSGRWELKMDPDFRGNPATVECTFKQANEQLTVKCRTPHEMTGEVRDGTVTFRTAPIPDNPLVVTFTAAVEKSGTVLDGTWHLTDGVLDKKGKFKARKHD